MARKADTRPTKPKTKPKAKKPKVASGVFSKKPKIKSKGAKNGKSKKTYA